MNITNGKVEKGNKLSFLDGERDEKRIWINQLAKGEFYLKVGPQESYKESKLCKVSTYSIFFLFVV